MKRVKDWAEAKTSRLEDSDIFISGNADEVFKATSIPPLIHQVLSRSSMHSLAHCQLSSEMATGVLWMPMGDPSQAFKPVWHVRDRHHSFHLPSIYTWGLVASAEQRGERHFKGSEDTWGIQGWLKVHYNVWNHTFKYEKIELLVCIYEIPRELVFIYGISGHSGWSSPFGSLHVLQQGTIKQMFW